MKKRIAGDTYRPVVKLVKVVDDVPVKISVGGQTYRLENDVIKSDRKAWMDAVVKRDTYIELLRKKGVKVERPHEASFKELERLILG